MPSEVEEFEIDPRIEKIVWRGLGVKSLKAIADETGLSRDDVIRIRTELLDGVDVLTEHQARTKLLVELESMVYEARDRAQRSDDEFYSGMMNSAVAAIKAIQAERQRMSKENKDKIDQLNQLRVRELLRLIDTSVASTLHEIADTHGLDEDELLGIFQSHLRPAASSLETA